MLAKFGNIHDEYGTLMSWSDIHFLSLLKSLKDSIIFRFKQNITTYHIYCPYFLVKYISKMIDWAISKNR